MTMPIWFMMPVGMGGGTKLDALLETRRCWSTNRSSTPGWMPLGTGATDLSHPDLTQSRPRCGDDGVRVNRLYTPSNSDHPRLLMFSLSLETIGPSPVVRAQLVAGSISGMGESSPN